MKMNTVWESVDKTVRKETVQKGLFLKKPTERSTCDVVVENIRVIEPKGLNTDQLKCFFNTEIVDNVGEKTIIIGDANCELDRKIERAIQMMSVKEQSLITVRITSPNGVEDGFVTIQFDATLRMYQAYQPIWDWSPEDKYKMALKYKETGVQLYKECRYVDAFHKFSKACKILITMEPIPDLELEKSLDDNVNNLRIVLYNNLAGCHLIRGNLDHVITLCNKILEKDENNVKALYRRGTAYGKQRNIEKAVEDFKKVIELEPQNVSAKEQYIIYNKKWQEANEKFKDMVKKMFKN